MDTAITFENIKNNLILLNPIDNPPPLPVENWAVKISSITAAPNGFNVNKPSVEPKIFFSINYISIFEVAGSQMNMKLLDLYLSGEKQPYRIPVNRINYSVFFPKIPSRMLEAFSAFILNVIDQAGALYVDEHTMDYLSDGTWKIFTDENEVNLHNWAVWSRVVDTGKRQCPRCKTYFWYGLEVPESKDRKICRKCETRQKTEGFIPTPGKSFVEDFQTHLNTRAQELIKQKCDEIKTFETYCKSKSLSDLNQEDITRYLYATKSSAPANIPTTIRESFLREYYEFCVSKGLRQSNPFS